MFDKVSFNPAAAGMDEMQCFTAIFRDQWDGFDRDPKTFLFDYDGYHKFEFANIGLGFTAISDRLGQERNTLIRFSGSYYVTSTEHSYKPSIGYRTAFSVRRNAT
jgi:hypothetical protein